MTWDEQFCYNGTSICISPTTDCNENGPQVATETTYKRIFQYFNGSPHGTCLFTIF
jgi:hypothetical protein